MGAPFWPSQLLPKCPFDAASVVRTNASSPSKASAHAKSMGSFMGNAAASVTGPGGRRSRYGDQRDAGPRAAGRGSPERRSRPPPPNSRRSSGRCGGRPGEPRTPPRRPSRRAFPTARPGHAYGRSGAQPCRGTAPGQIAGQLGQHRVNSEGQAARSSTSRLPNHWRNGDVRRKPHSPV